MLLVLWFDKGSNLVGRVVLMWEYTVFNVTKYEGDPKKEVVFLEGV